jgi:hypothetical protein
MVLAAPVQAQQQPSGKGRQFTVGSWTAIEELPLGRIRSRLGQLPPEAQRRALGWLRSFHFTDHDLVTLEADDSGGIYFVDPAPERGTAVAETPAPTPAEAALAVTPFPANLHFHSRPGAPNVLYLNFSGETVTNTEWNKTLGRLEIPALAFSLDVDRTTFSADEQLAIRRIWSRVAEDYAPFNLDVTTERPLSFTTRTAHAVITRSSDANGQVNPASTAGGVAYVNVFGTTSYANYRPAWVYDDNLGQNEANIAEAAAHEIGHNLGLSHDGSTNGSVYYGGHGSGETSWGPLMGTGYNRNVSQWSKGEYYQANNPQDDLATLAGKLTYRLDDHGSTAGTATALNLTGGTNVVATTPATDPANLSPANKGLLERNTDVDVFSFVTGNGAVSLAVDPWVEPSGTTRGGNLDVELQLYDEVGTLLQTVQPAERTGARLSLPLAAGRYFLQVRNTGAGNPLNAPPSGYTSYGSVGQYFINGFVTANNGVVVPPVAELQVADINAPTQGALTFTVTYSDDVAVKAATLDDNDVRVTGPHGFNRLARFVAVNSLSDGTPRVATYAVDPPTGSRWLPAHNGIYVLALESQQVSDAVGAWAPSGPLGQFTVAVPVAFYFANLDTDPGWTLESEWEFGVPAYGATGPAAGFTGTQLIGYNLRGNYANRLATQYATSPPINTAGSANLTLRFRRWLRVQNNDTAVIEVSTNGTAWTRLWTAPRRVADTAWQEVQYPLPPGFAGNSSIRLRWGMGSNASQNDLGWNLDDVVLLGEGTLDAVPPVAALSVADLTVGGSPSHACSVTLTDATAVRLSSLDAADLVVTGPNGFLGTVEFIGADLPADGTPITAAYSIPAPGGTWEAADNGVYQLALVEDEVTDVFSNAAPPAPLGSFTVAIPLSQQALVVTPVAFTVSEGGEATFTVRLAEVPENPVTVTTLRVGGAETILVVSGGTVEFTAANWMTPQTVTLRAELDADQEPGSAVFECRASGLLPVTLLVTQQEAEPGRLGITFPEGITFSGPVGGPFAPGQFTCGLTNSGGSRLDWRLTPKADWLTFSAIAGTLDPQAGTNLTFSLNGAANTLPAGTFTQILGFTNLTSGLGDTTRPVSLTINPLATVNFSLSVNEPSWGSATPASGSYPVGSALELRATPAPFFSFREWRGDVTSTENPLALLLSADRTVEAVFAELFTNLQPTPLWWLAAHGVTNDFEFAGQQTGANGLPRWQSYVAGLNPNEPTSQLRLAGQLAPDGTAFVLQWSTVSNRVYSLWTGAPSLTDLTPLPGAQGLPWTTNTFLHTVEPTAPARFYQLRVELP